MAKDKKRITMCPSCECRYRTPEAFLGRRVSCKNCGNSFKVDFEVEKQEEESNQVSMLKQGEIDTISQDDAFLVMGKLAVKYKFVDNEQLKEALSHQKQEQLNGNQALLGEIMVAKGMMSQNQLDYLLSIQMAIEARKMDRTFGMIAVKNGFATQEDIEQALIEQEKSYENTKTVKMIGDILVESNVMTRDQCDAILKKQQRFEGIDSAEPEKSETPLPPDASVNDAYFNLTVSEDKLNAFFSINKKNTVSFTLKEVRNYLEKNGIKYGIVDDEKISEYLMSKETLDTPLMIAEGKPPDKGIDAYIKYHFDTDPLKIGTVKEGGTIDFKDRGELPQVAKGDLLAEKIPAVEGTTGYDVYGRYLTVSKPKDITLRKGKGTSISEDKLKINAEVDGIPEISAVGKVYVSPKLEISGGVGLKTGHVDFDGKIDVIGTIQSGYRVRGNSLRANEILKAEIEMDGDISIHGGIIGAKIKGNGSISAMYVHESDIEVLGDVIVEKEIIDSKINTSGTCITKNGPILSSRVSAKKGIQAIQIGSEISKPCNLSVGFDDKLKEDISELKEIIPLKKQEQKECHRRLKEIEKEPDIIQKVIADMAQVQDRAVVKQRKLSKELETIEKAGDDARLEHAKDKFSKLGLEIEDREKKLESLFNKQDQIQTEIDNLNQKIEDSNTEILDLREKISEIVEWSTSEQGVPEVKVRDVIFADTTISGIYSTLKIDQNQKSVLIKEDIPKDTEDISNWDLDRDKFGSKIRIKPL
jgi:uncharacterized protein (DUF342 family)